MEGEKKKFDLNSLIGFLIIGGIILYLINSHQEEGQKKEDENPEAKQEQVESHHADSSGAEKAGDTTALADHTTTTPDSAETAKADEEKFGVFAYSKENSSAGNDTTVLENSVLRLKVSNKGGQIVEAKLKKEKKHDSLPVYLVKDGNSTFNIDFSTTGNRNLRTEDLYFQPELSENEGNTTLSMKLKVSGHEYLEYIYTLKPDDYMLDFAVKSRGLNNIFDSSKDIDLNWDMKGYSHGRSYNFENRYSKTGWYYEGSKHSKQRSGDSEADDISWVTYRQHFFTSVLLNENGFKSGKMTTTDLDKEDEDEDKLYTKEFNTTFPLELKNGELDENMNFYYGPTDYKLLKSYDRDLGEMVPLGWGIFGWINKYAFIPVFNFLMSHLPAGFAIILLTVVVKILLSPVQYKQFLSQAKRKVLQPEIDEINEKYKDNKMKLQQETMQLNRKAGINPASGCLVGLIQMPIFYAMFRLFPSAFQLRHQSFLWAEDLSSYDAIINLSFRIPIYGDHVSLFSLLAGLAILVYMTQTTGNSMQNMPKQPGMPNMKYIMYISPLFMVVFFNRYPSGLSLYYLTSNLIAIGIYLVIQNYIIDNNKVHAKIQKKKKKPRKQNRFQRKMKEMMEEAEKQQNQKKK